MRIDIDITDTGEEIKVEYLVVGAESPPSESEIDEAFLLKQCAESIAHQFQHQKGYPMKFHSDV